jgi:hypothetical protein
MKETCSPDRPCLEPDGSLLPSFCTVWIRIYFAQEMKQFALSLLLVWPLILGFFQRSADASTTDYALMSATPYYSEIALARERLEKFLYKADAKKRAILAQTPVVAVQAAVLEAFEAGSMLRWIGREGYFGTGGASYPGDQARRQVEFLLLFDSRTSQLVSDDGVLVLITPQCGRIGVFGGVSALYIGAGW